MHNTPSPVDSQYVRLERDHQIFTYFIVVHFQSIYIINFVDTTGAQ